MATLHGRPLNFDPEGPHDTEHGWHLDDYCHALPREAPGPPEAEGSWEIARRLMRHYEFANPKRVRAYWEADAGLEGRDMLLELRFLGIRRRTGVRIAAVWDEETELEGRAARTWGWAYRTLAGHLERGQMDYTVCKFLDTGEVQFRIHAYSARARIANPVIRLGFRLFGRREQVGFARFAARRMAELTQAVLDHGPAVEPGPERRGRLLVSPSPLRDPEREEMVRAAGARLGPEGPQGGSAG
ncbi:MAG TPA: DUF1990 family protein [Solirubrobacteraceae bacterium]